MIEKRKAYLTGIHPYSYKSGEPAEIIGVVLVKALGYAERPCFHIKFLDGAEDYSPISDIEHYNISGELTPPFPEPIPERVTHESIIYEIRNDETRK